MRRKTIIAICLFLTGLLGLAGCGSPSSGYDYEENVNNRQTAGALVYESSMELQYVLYVVSDEMIPETHAHGNERGATYALLVGFCIMLISDVLLG